MQFKIGGGTWCFHGWKRGKAFAVGNKIASAIYDYCDKLYSGRFDIGTFVLHLFGTT